MARKQYSDETKAAVMAALLTGQSISSVAKEYKIPEGTVKGWKSRQGSGEEVAKVVTQKKARIGELLIEYLEANLTALKAQAEMFGTEEWLMEQSAGEVAVLHGVMTDKAVRLLEALSRASDNNTSKN